jgi:hypothetical protein
MVESSNVGSIVEKKHFFEIVIEMESWEDISGGENKVHIVMSWLSPHTHRKSTTINWEFFSMT